MTLMEKKYPICPECGCNTLAMFSPPREGIIGTKEGYRTIGTPEYVDWNRVHLYCTNGTTNCKFDTRIMELTTPIQEERYCLLASLPAVRTNE